MLAITLSFSTRAFSSSSVDFLEDPRRPARGDILMFLEVGDAILFKTFGALNSSPSFHRLYAPLDMYREWQTRNSAFLP